MKSLDLFKGGLPQAGNLRYTTREQWVNSTTLQRVVKINEEETFKMLKAGPRMSLTLCYLGDTNQIHATVELEYSDSVNPQDKKVLEQAASLFRRILEGLDTLTLLTFGDNFLTESDRMTSDKIEKRYLW